jgi:hypothetical protein
MSTAPGTPAIFKTLETKGAPATAGMPIIAMMQAIAGTPAISNNKDDSMTARNSRNESNLSNRRKVPEKDSKKRKIALFCQIYFNQTDSYRTIGSPMLPVR